MDDSVFQKSAVVSQHSYRINKRDHATKLTPELHTYRQEPMYVMASLENKPWYSIMASQLVLWSTPKVRETYTMRTRGEGGL